jgi:RNA polymerase sigma-70 factor (ECF subfamily)
MKAQQRMNSDEDFLSLITEFQGRLYGFILSMLGDVDQANEVLQETNLVLWRKSDDFQPGTDFKAWSFRVAHFQAMAFRQRQVRDRLMFDSDTLERITREASKQDEAFARRMDLLDECIENLSEQNREIVTRFYKGGESLDEIAQSVKRKANAVGQILYRIRKALIECVSEKDKEGVIDVI